MNPSFAIIRIVKGSIMKNQTLAQFLHGQQRQDNQLNPDIAQLMTNIANACKHIAVAVRTGALHGNMGSLDSENVQGETQKQLDVIANDIFLQMNVSSGLYAGMASEELEDPYALPEAYVRHGKYLLLFDPLDGSSNVDVNISVGTIFSILRCDEGIKSPALKDFLQPGTAQICAGYACYGSSTMLVFTTGQGVDGFTLDTEADEFLLTHPNMQIPADTDEFAINMSNCKSWDVHVTRYIEECLCGVNGVRGKQFNMRWVGSMVAEIHRILVRGGIFLYPLDSKNRMKGGRLRLMYEANPMSFIIEQAGGMSVSGGDRIMALLPDALHQRIPVIMGSRNEVDRLHRYYLD